MREGSTTWEVVGERQGAAKMGCARGVWVATTSAPVSRGPRPVVAHPTAHALRGNMFGERALPRTARQWAVLTIFWPSWNHSVARAVDTPGRT